MKYTAGKYTPTSILVASALLTFGLVSASACDIPNKEIGDGDDDSTTTNEGGTNDTGPNGEVDCEQLCGGVERACEYDVCCSCAMLGGQLLVLESFPPQYHCEGAEGEWVGDTCEWGECQDQVTTLPNLDEVFEPVGVTPHEMLGVIGGMAAPLDWDDSEILLNVPGPTTDVQLDVVPVSEVRGVESVWVPPEGYPQITGECRSRIEVDVDVPLWTTDGALAEAFVGTVVAVEDPESMTVQVSLHHELPVDGFEGTLELSAAENATLSPYVELDVSFGYVGEPDPNDEGDMGTLTVGLEIDHGDALSFGWIEFGRWMVGGG